MSPNIENLGPRMKLFAYLQISSVVAWPSSVYHHKSFNRTYPEAIYSHGSDYNKDIGIQENASVQLWKESVKTVHYSVKNSIIPYTESQYSLIIKDGLPSS